MLFWLGLAVGIFLGINAGVILGCMLHVGRQADDDMDRLAAVILESAK